ncbi:MAG: DUF2007 domain-containing protein [Pseudomonadota bacterium]
MKRVYVSDNPIIAGHLQSILEANNIATHLRNDSLTGGIGELPINECWPEIWVNDERDYELALTLINATLNSNNTNVSDWLCQCGEKIEAQFDSCWSCGNINQST